MVPFLVDACASDGSVTLDTGSPTSSDFWIGPQRYGAAKVYATGDAVESTDIRMNGLRYTSDGVLRVYNTHFGVPATATMLGGIAVTEDGQLCVTTATPDATSYFIGGNAVMQDGSLCVTGLFSPLDLTPAAWFPYGVGVTAAGGFASAWADQSGNGRNLLQATGTNQPAYSGGIFTFDGADNFMKTAPFTLNQPETVYILFKQVSWTVDDRVFDGNASLGGVLYQSATTPSLKIWAGAEVGANANLAVGAYGVAAVVFNGASSVLQINNTTPTTGNAGTNNMGGLTLASAGTPGSYGNIQVKEVIIYPAAHDATTRAQVISYLMGVGGI